MPRRTEDLNREEWATTILMGAAVLPLGVVMRFLPPSVEGERNFAGYKPRYACFVVVVFTFNNIVEGK